jgi:hypothetical protein
MRQLRRQINQTRCRILLEKLAALIERVPVYTDRSTKQRLPVFCRLVPRHG